MLGVSISVASSTSFTWGRVIGERFEPEVIERLSGLERITFTALLHTSITVFETISRSLQTNHGNLYLAVAILTGSAEVLELVETALFALDLLVVCDLVTRSAVLDDRLSGITLAVVGLILSTNLSSIQTKWACGNGVKNLEICAFSDRLLSTSLKKISSNYTLTEKFLNFLITDKILSNNPSLLFRYETRKYQSKLVAPPSVHVDTLRLR